MPARVLALAAVLAGCWLTLAAPQAGARPQRHHRARHSQARVFAATVRRMLALPYQPDYVPSGADDAFPATPATVANDFPAQDYTSGSIPGSPDHPQWPPIFKPVTLHSADGATLLGELAMHPGRHPAILVVHGFNTNGKESVIRWAALLAHDGYDVLAADQRDFGAEYNDRNVDAAYMQTFGWKESQDVLAAGRYLRVRPGVTSEGIVGFSEGGQNAVLALAQDTGHVFSAALTFSGPADQDTQIYSTAVPPSCSTPACAYPATDVLIALVVPPYSYGDPCQVLTAAATDYHTTPYAILARESAFHAQARIRVPLLNFYAADDPLVHPFQAAMMAGYEEGHPLQRTVEITRGAHAYYYDRWWQQKAILTYFHALLPGARVTSTSPTVNRTPGGAPLSDQLVSLAGSTRAAADRQLAPYICDTTKAPPG